MYIGYNIKVIFNPNFHLHIAFCYKVQRLIFHINNLEPDNQKPINVLKCFYFNAISWALMSFSLSLLKIKVSVC